MEDKGNFVALMFLAMAFGCGIVYFNIGYTSNEVSTVSIGTETCKEYRC